MYCHDWSWRSEANFKIIWSAFHLFVILVRTADQDPSVVADTASAYAWRHPAGREGLNQLSTPRPSGAPTLLHHHVLTLRPHHSWLHLLPLPLCMMMPARQYYCWMLTQLCTILTNLSQLLGLSGLRCWESEVIYNNQGEKSPPIRAKESAVCVNHHFWINEEIGPELWSCPDRNEAEGWIRSILGAVYCTHNLWTITWSTNYNLHRKVWSPLTTQLSWSQDC